MGTKKHWAIFIDNSSDKGFLIELLLNRNLPNGFEALNGLQGSLFSKKALERFIDEEERHDAKIITQDTGQSLKTMSSGEQKKALLKHLLKTDPEFIVLDNPFDNLDTDSQAVLKQRLLDVSSRMHIVQIISRKADLLPFVNTFAQLEYQNLKFCSDAASASASENTVHFSKAIPAPLKPIDFAGNILIDLRSITISYSDRPILDTIEWTIKKGDFWQLMGKNGSGKTTILSMITGENPKGYGQELYIFGQKKGSGESVWDIKKKIGYFTPSMTDKFTGYHTIEHMLISGLNDSIGLYVKPNEAQLRLAKKWLLLIGMWEIKDTHFHDLTMGQQRLVMTTRAMVKHPLLLILDEPTAGLDDASAGLLVSLVNKIARESETAIVFVSHRNEPGLKPNFVYELQMGKNGSKGIVKQ